MNASDERGIDVIRDKVKLFAKTTVRETADGYPCPTFKLIVLDEADSLTNDAQTALRRIMEVNAKGTRFCIICNYVSRIIEPLTSRCAKFRFRPVDLKAGVDRLRFICEAEGIKFQSINDHDNDSKAMEKVKQETLETLLTMTEGDLRRAVMLLQSCHRIGSVISIPWLQEYQGIIPETLIDEAHQLCQQSGNVVALMEFVKKKILRQAHSVQQFIKQLALRLIDDPTIDIIRKSMISLVISQIDHQLSEGADEYLQILRLLCNYQRILCLSRGAQVPAFSQM